MTTIIMRTSEGDITIDLFDDKTPNTVANFLGLATGEKEWADPYTGQPSHGKFYNGLTFHLSLIHICNALNRLDTAIPEPVNTEKPR